MLGVGDWIVGFAPAEVGLDVAVGTLDAFAVVGLFAGQARQLGKNIKMT